MEAAIGCLMNITLAGIACRDAYASRKNRAYLRIRGIRCTIPEKADGERALPACSFSGPMRPVTLYPAERIRVQSGGRRIGRGRL